MSDPLPLALLIGCAILFGIVCTLLVQSIGAVRRLAGSLTATSEQIGELVRTLRPTASRISQLSAAAEESEPDLRRLQVSLAKFSRSSEEMTDQLSRVSRWLGVGVPLVIAAVERWQATDTTQPGERTNMNGGAAAGPATAPQAAQGVAPNGG